MNAENANLRNISARVSESDYTLEQLKNQNEVLQNETERYSKEISELNLRISQISADNRTIEEENHSLTQGNEELKIKMEFLEREKENFDGERSKLLEEKQDLHKNVEEIERELNDVKQKNLELVNDKVTANSNEVDISKIQQDFYEIKEKCDSLFVENRNLKSEYAKLEGKCNDFSKIRKQLETQIAEMENQYTEMIHERQLLKDEIQELKISPVNIQGDSSKLDHLEIIKQEKSFTTDASRIDKDKFLKEIELLQDKLTQYKSLDITNKSSIEFYENELQKIKSQNEKLNRKLDETLVTLSHCAELSTSTEVEYLKNVLYNYMLGKESLVLARVIAAVCKFDPEQTDAVLQREQQKQTLVYINSSETILALAFTASFISDISLSISSIKCITKSTSLCLYICSVWKLVMRKLISYPSMGFLLKTMKFSARIIMNLMNFLHRIFSISSACLTDILILTELTDVSMSTFSFSFLDMTTGVSTNSLELLTSTSGLLCLSTTCEEKLSKHIAAVNVWRTAVR
ncbi:hypothetical protein NQ317_005047 [Molorchus minor]|uniref:GRIP domain-containing protein n=1 Tax=Molorchus minor TaxID=1323400 RepID=A0ABQ9JW83_9CUCU|nr:hypothetical protein NQ317_005047 [Molorchus minor]